MISYAQNFEDVILWRAFAAVDKGFYIDVGACFPEIGSVTKLFYDAGWHGVNIEPHPDLYRQLAERRKQDVNLNIALSSNEGCLTLFEGLTLGETSAKAIPERESFEVQAQTLKAVCEEHVRGAIQFLKVDVEGMEYEVLLGGDWKAFRPQVVLCEVTAPWTNQKTDIEPRINAFLAQQDYDLVYFDGLNNFYVAREHAHLADQLVIPPNVIDGFTTLTEARLQEEIASLKEAHPRDAEFLGQPKIQQQHQDDFLTCLDAMNHLHAESARQTDAFAKAEAALQERLSMAERQIEWLHQSTSWRVTAPLRFVRRCLNFLGVGSWAWLTLRPGSRPRRVARRLVVGFAGRLSPHRRLTALAKHMLSSFPALEARLRGMVQAERAKQYHSTFQPEVVEGRAIAANQEMRPGRAGTRAQSDSVFSSSDTVSNGFAALAAATNEWKRGKRINA